MPSASLTAKLKLDFFSDEDTAKLEQTAIQYKNACNFVSEFIFNNDFLMHQIKLNNAVYSDLREKFELKSQMAQSVTRTVVARYRTTKQQLLTNPFRYKDENDKWQSIKKDLTWLQKPILFRRSQLDLVANRDWSYSQDNNILSLNTIKGRIKTTPINKGFEKYFDGTWSFGTAKIVKIKNNWFFHLAVAKETEDFNKDEVNHVVGIDRGLRFLATSYDEKGKVEFFDGKKIITKRNNYKRLRAELQSKGTRSAKRKLKRISDRENRWMTDVNHSITKTLVEKYGKNTLFVLEDLTGIRFNSDYLGKSTKDQVNSWAFFQFESFLAYKAQQRASEVLKVSPKYTSQRCPKCGTINKNNRNHKTHEYHCKNCGYCSNDDRTAAMNIQELGTLYISGITNPKFEKILQDTD